MAGKYFWVALVAIAGFSCYKDDASRKDKYVASANKINALAGMNWNDVEPQLKHKVGYRFEAAPPNVSNLLKGEVHLPAIDDSSRIEDGEVYLHIATNNMVDRALYATQPLPQSVAYAMMLNYNNEALRTPSGITPLQGQYIQNGTGGIASVASILSKVRSKQAADNLSIVYGINGRGIQIHMGVTRKNDGRYEFGYVSSP